MTGRTPATTTVAPGNVGFFLFPPAEEGGGHAAMSSPVTFGIAANAKNPDCAAFFLDWVATNPEARQINVSVGGSNPGGPSDLPIPEVAEGSVTNETLAAAQQVAAEDGLMDFIANATGTIFTRVRRLDARAPEDGRWPADGRRACSRRVQATYEESLDQ